MFVGLSVVPTCFLELCADQMNRILQLASWSGKVLAKFNADFEIRFAQQRRPILRKIRGTFFAKFGDFSLTLGKICETRAKTYLGFTQPIGAWF